MSIPTDHPVVPPGRSSGRAGRLCASIRARPSRRSSGPHSPDPDPPGRPARFVLSLPAVSPSRPRPHAWSFRPVSPAEFGHGPIPARECRSIVAFPSRHVSVRTVDVDTNAVCLWFRGICVSAGLASPADPIPIIRPSRSLRVVLPAVSPAVRLFGRLFSSLESLPVRGDVMCAKRRGRGRPPKHPAKVKKRRYLLRLSEQEYAFLQQRAKDQNTTIAELLTRHALAPLRESSTPE